MENTPCNQDVAMNGFTWLQDIVQKFKNAAKGNLGIRNCRIVVPLIIIF